MEEIRVRMLQKQQKKVEGVICDLSLLLDAQKHVMANTGLDADVCTQITEAIESLRGAAYALLLAEASSEDEQIAGRMMTDLERFAAAAGEK